MAEEKQTLEHDRNQIRMEMGFRERKTVDAETVTRQLADFHTVMEHLNPEENKEMVRLLIREVGVNHYDPEKDKFLVGETFIKTKIRTQLYSVNISFYANDLFSEVIRTGINQFVSQPKWLPEARQISKKSPRLSLEFIITVPPGQRWNAPVVDAPFIAHLGLRSGPPIPSPTPTLITQKQSTASTIRMVRSWAVELKRNANLKLSDIARKHGLSRARVTQLMPLALLDEKLITEKLRMNRKASVRDLLKLAVQTRPNN